MASDPRTILTFEDVSIIFTPEEWEIIDDDQKRLYIRVIMLNLSTVLSLGLPISRWSIILQQEPVDEPRELERAPREQQRESRVTEEVDASPASENVIMKPPDPNYSHSMENEDASSEQDCPIKISEVRSLQVGSSMKMDHPVLDNNLLQSEKPGTSAGKQPYSDKSPERAFRVIQNPDQVIEQQNGKEFDRMENGHVSSVKNNRLQIEEKFSTCKVSVEGLITNLGLDEHQATHSENEPFRSVQCEEALDIEQKDYMHSEAGKASSHKKNSEQPQNTNGRQKHHESSIYGMSISHGTSFVLPKETNNSPYKCIVCNKSFVYRSTFLLHEQIHSGVKPYTCDECGKSYHRRYHLTQHLRVHSGHRPFKCNVCGKAYIRKDVLNVHQRKHAGVKFQCEECGKLFAHSFYIMIHKRIHHGIRPYLCDECGKTFISKSHLTQHKKRSHTTSIPSGKMNVEYSSVELPVSSYTRDLTMEQDLMYSMDVGEPTEDEEMNLST